MNTPNKTGRLVITKALNDAQNSDPEMARQLSIALSRYLKGDWGDIDDDDKASNDDAAQSGNDRIIAKYVTSAGNILIITECDRSYTTLMFCDEY